MPNEPPITAALAAPGADAADVVVDVSGLRVSYDGIEAVKGIDLRVSRGEIFTFLGPNGADKTTTVEVLAGQMHAVEDPTEGDHHAARARTAIGLWPRTTSEGTTA